MITKFFVWIYKLLHRPVLIITNVRKGWLSMETSIISHSVTHWKRSSVR